MRALVVRQPWAWLIVQGYKDVENRTWRTKHRGPLLILAGVTPDAAALDDPELLGWLAEHGVELPTFFDRGGIVGSVRVVDCVSKKRAHSFWADGPWCWILVDAEPIPFTPFRGQQGLFEIPGSTVGEVLEGIRAGP